MTIASAIATHGLTPSARAALVVHRRRQRLPLYQELARGLEPPLPDDPEFTCDRCDAAATCWAAFDAVNTDGDCLAAK